MIVAVIWWIGTYAESSNFIKIFPNEECTLAAWNLDIQFKADNVVRGIDNNIILQISSSIIYEPWGYIYMHPIFITCDENGNFISDEIAPQCDYWIKSMIFNGEDRYYFIPMNQYNDPLGSVRVYEQNSWIYSNVVLPCSNTVFISSQSIFNKHRGFVVAGFARQSNEQIFHPYVAFFNEDGVAQDYLFFNNFYFNENHSFRYGFQTIDRGFLLYSHDTICKLDSDHNIEWIRKIDDFSSADIIRNRINIVELSVDVYCKMTTCLDEHTTQTVTLSKFEDQINPDGFIEYETTEVVIGNIFSGTCDYRQINPTMLRTADGNFIIYFSTYLGELHKFDSDLNFMWRKNLLPDLGMEAYIEGVGTSPIIEMDNGDLLFCAGMHESSGSSSMGVALVRCNSDGEIVSINGNIVETPSLELKVYPNPFSPTNSLRNSSAMINFTLPESVFTRIEIINIKGQLVKKLFSDFLKQGRHEFSWDGRNESGHITGSGVYLVRVSSQNYNLIKKIIVIK